MDLNVHNHFRQRSPSNKSFVSIQIEDISKCSSHVGRHGGIQTLKLSQRCALREKTVFHEFMHAIGVHHYQQRPDRDEYMTINWTNMKVKREEVEMQGGGEESSWSLLLA